MAALDFPASPTVGQTATLTNGIMYQWDGAVWATAASTGQTAGGDLSGTYPNPTVVKASGDFSLPTAFASVTYGPGVTKGRTFFNSVSGSLNLETTVNSDYNGTSWTTDDTAKPSWLARLSSSGDAFQIYRAPAAASPTPWASLLTLDGAGNLIVAGNSLNLKSEEVMVSRVGGTEWTVLMSNDAWHPPVTTQASLVFNIRSDTDQFVFSRRPPNGPAATQATIAFFDGNSNLQIMGPTGVKSAGTTWANPSDVRIKRNITDYKVGLAEILELRPIRFEFNGFAGTAEGKVAWGYLAEEVMGVMPECVGKTTRTVDEEEIELDLLDTSNISLAMVNAIKELAARVAALEK